MGERTSRGDRTRRRFLRSSAVTATFGAFAGCMGGDDGDDTTQSTAQQTTQSKTQKTTQSTVQKGGKLIFGQSHAPSGPFDPLRSQEAYTTDVTRYVHAWLLVFGEGIDHVPGLAKSMPEITNDGMRYTVEIVENAKAHNGDPITSEDVTYIYHAAMEEESHLADQFNKFESVKAIDEYTVQFNLKEFLPPKLVYRELFFPVLPKNAREKHKDDGYGTDIVIGAGPFKFVDWTQGEYALIRKWDDYWGPEPNIDEIEYRPIEESTTRITNMKTGDTHVARLVPPDLRQQVEQMENVRMIDQQALNYRFLAFNCNEGFAADPKAREAIAHCVDLDEVTNGFVGKNGEPMYSPFPPILAEEWDFPVEEWANQWPGKDIEKAKQLFDEADFDGDNEFKLLTPPEDLRTNIGVSITNGMQEAGIDAQTQRTDWGPLLDTIFSGNANKYNAYIIGWTPDTPDPDTYTWDILHIDGWANGSFWENETAMDALEQARGLSKRQKRKTHYETFVQEYLNDTVHLPLFNQLNTAMARNVVKDFDLLPATAMNPAWFTERYAEQSGIDGTNVWLDE